MILHNYPNHDYINGTLYRGLNTKRIVRPDNNGLYAVRFRGAIHRLTEQEILTATVKKDLIIAQPVVKIKTNKVGAKINVSSLCRPLGVKFSTYHKWAQNNGHFNKTGEISADEHKKLIEKYAERMEELKSKSGQKDIRDLCEKSKIGFDGYKSNLRRIGILYGSLDKNGHAKEIENYKSRIKFNAVNKIVNVCKKYDVDYDQYKLRLAKIGLIYDQLTYQGHKSQIRGFRDLLFKQGKKLTSQQGGKDE